MSDRVPSRIENLPNEIWLEVFHHLDWINVFSAFYGINKRINQLLMCINTLSLYSSCLINYSNSIYVYFQEFPLKEFKKIQHFRLNYDNPYVDGLNIAKDLPTFSTLLSLAIDANNGEHKSNNELAMNIFHQNCPLLQRLHLHGDVFDEECQKLNRLPVVFSSSLRHIHVSKIRVDLALDILDQFPQLRSFSAKLYGDVRKAYPTSAIVLPDRVNMGLPAMRNLSLTKDNTLFHEFANECGGALIELLVTRCPNLRSFKLDADCQEDWERLLEATWWERVFASHNQLKRISLRLKYTTRDIRNTWHQKYQRLQSSLFFTQLNANMRFNFESEFMRSLTYDLYIQN